MSSLDTTSIARQIEQDGYAVTPPVFSPDELSAVERECAQLLAGTDRWAVLNTTGRSKRLREFAAHRVFREICQCTIGADVDLFFDGVIFKRSGASKELRWHQDAAFGRTDPFYIACWTPLTPASPNAGGLCVAPGSHRQGTLPHRREPASDTAYPGPVCEVEPDDTIELDVGPGQTVILQSNLLHRSGPNRSPRDRVAFQCGYVSSATRYLDPGIAGDAKRPIFRREP